MSDQISDLARRAVNDALTSAGSAVVGQLVDTTNLSKFKREEARKQKEECKKKKDEDNSNVRARTLSNWTSCSEISGC